jgi:hypothetical protein
MENLSNLEIQTINQRLAETIAWCESRVDITKPESCFRSKELQPSINFDWHLDQIQRNSIIQEVSNLRQKMLQRDTQIQVTKTPNLALGKILVFEIDGTLSDSAAQVATNGFFTYENTPPWDTWFAHMSADFLSENRFDILLSWIPREFFSLVEEGIYVNPEYCIFWLDDKVVQQLFNQLETEKKP